MAEEISPLENHGWWMEQLRKDAKANWPEALRLADVLDHVELRPSDYKDVDKAAAELRRLHAENERLHQINQSHEMKLSVRGYEIQIEDLRLAHAELRKVSGELLEALKRHGAHDGNCDYLILLTSLPPMRKPCSCGLHAAIAKAEGEAK
jgi:hypothetical protein